MKKILTFILTITMMLSFTTNVVCADGTGTQASPWEIGASGNESGVTAYLDGGVLYINGSGQMKNQGVESWPWYSVKDTIATAVIADGITNTGRSVFRELTNLSAVSIPNSVTTIDSTTFYQDTSLTNIVLPNALTQIGTGAFRYSGLTSIVIPATVTSIGSEAFKDCSSLNSVRVLSTTPPTINGNTFENDDSLQIYVPQSSVDTYKAATNWSALKDRIQAIPFTIEDMLNKADNGFPVSNSLANVPANAWLKSDGTKLFMNNGITPISLVVSGAGSSFSILAELTQESQNKYKYSNETSGNIHFTLDSNELISIEIDSSNDANANGIYKAPPTVGDIIPRNFPTSSTSAWTNGNGSVYLVGDDVKIDGSIKAFSLDTPVTKDTNGNYYIYNSSLTATITFIMDDSEFTSIEVTGLPSPYDGYNGTFVAPITIDDILKTVPGGFPKTSSLGWVKADNSNDDKVYIDGTNLKVAGVSCPLNSALTKDGITYKYVQGSATYIFTMESNVLKSITLDVLFSPSAGEYIPYKYENEVTESKPQGYTGDLVFKTNGKFTDASNVVVEVDGNELNSGVDYIAEQGSIKVTLLGSYISKLAPKTYTISIGTKDGKYAKIDSQFTITGSTPTPSSNTKTAYKAPKTGIE